MNDDLKPDVTQPNGPLTCVKCSADCAFNNGEQCTRCVIQLTELASGQFICDQKQQPQDEDS